MVEIQVSIVIAHYDTECYDAEYIDEVNGQQSKWDEPKLALPRSRIAEDEYGKQDKEAETIARIPNP